MKDWIDELKKGLRGDVLIDEENLKKYSRDASIFEVKPKVVVCPKDENDLRFLVEFANKHPGISLTGRAAGTDMTGGPLSTSVVVSFTQYFDKIKRLTKKTAIVQPGVYYRNFEKKADKIKVIFPSYPASKSICAMGGIIANNSGGEKSLSFGQTVDHVKKLKVILADGNFYELKKLDKFELNKKLKKKDFEGQIYNKIFHLCEKNYDLIRSAEPKVSKNSCGYYLWKVWDREKGTFDLSKLFVGSQGTIGLWTEAEIDVVKKDKHSRLVAVFLKDLKQITPLIDMVKKYHPQSLESFDKNTMDLGIRFFPEIAKKVHQNIISFLWGLRREAENTLLHGLPIFIILVELAGDKEKEIQERANVLGKELDQLKINNLVMQSEQEGEKYWIMRRESFNLLREKVREKSATPFVDDFSVKPEYLSEFLPKLYDLLIKNGIQPNLAGHVGDGNFHIIPLMDLKKEEERKKIPKVLKDFTNLVKEYRGTIAAEHNDGLIRTSYVEKQFGRKIVGLFEDVKNIFDKDNIFNPGKKVHGNMRFAMSHIKRS
ncbi:FAD-binding oxidoreductase [Candidatus Pacearchaeota archaeon]|nr:FAD-binding oxidoreductase [Candidatus Pacearchaeota archaeon]